MSEAKVTDDLRGGPWVYDGRLTVYQMDEGTPDICTLADDEYAEVHAFAITALPELIDACERAEFWLSTHPEGAEMQKVLQAALAKAEGRQP